MSDEQSEEKSEEPSQRKLRKARERGEIARSQDLAMVISSIGAAAAVWALIDWQAAHISDIARLAMSTESLAVDAYLFLIRDAIMTLLTPVIIGGFSASLLGNFLANKGFILAFEKIKPNIAAMSPKAYFKRTFSKKGMVDLAKITLFVVVLFIIYVQLSRFFAGDFFKLPACGMDCGFRMFALLTALCLAIGLTVALATALADIRLQSFLFLDQQRSTKTEAKREMKEDMGEPVMRQERRRQHSVFVGPNLIEAVGSSSVVLRDGHTAAAAISVFHVSPGKRQYFLAQSGIGPATDRLLETAFETYRTVVDSYGLATKLCRYEANSEITDPTLHEEIEFVLRKIGMGMTK